MLDAGAPHRSKRDVFAMPVGRLGSLALAAMLLAATGVIGLVTVDRIQSSRDLVLHTYHVRGLLKDLRAEIGDAHANFDLYQLSGNPSDLSGLEDQLQHQLLTVQELKGLTVDSAVQQQHLNLLQSLLEQDVGQFLSCIRQQNCFVRDSPSEEGLMSLVSGRRRNLYHMLRNMEAHEDSLLEGRLADFHRLFMRLSVVLGGCFGLALLLLFYNFNLLFREIEQRKKQELLERNNAESYKMLSARILELQDMERRKIARELHDSVGQFLAGLKINLGRLQRRDSAAAVPAHPLVDESIELTDRAIGEIRTISHLLHPPLLDELGFHSAARWYVEGFAKRSGMQVNLQLADIVERLPREIELALFRVLQESLTNVHRHAKASRVDIEVECTDDEVILVVRDDGNGLSRDVLQRFRAGHAGGIGLAGMRERLAELGGTLEVESGPSGTQIRAILPTHECDPADAPSENISIPPIETVPNSDKSAG
jgi:signal transduction histidine kinase